MTGAFARGLLLLAAVLVTGAARADLPRLPGELQLPRGADSPGQVVFRHDNHVDSAHPACLTCHPKRFSILKRGTEVARRLQITHAIMEKGQACGACHGKAAFGFDDCTMCHSK